MAFVNYAKREIILKIVYYGPGLSGKTSNIQHIHSGTTPEARGQLVSLETKEERTLYFDYLPMSLPQIENFETRLHLYSVPGQLMYTTNRKQILQNADGVIFVADSQESRREANLIMMEDLRENLEAHGFELDKFPIVIQFNKRDLDDIMSVEQLHEDLNPEGLFPEFEASVIKDGAPGVFESLKAVVQQILVKLKEKESGAS